MSTDENALTKILEHALLITDYASNCCDFQEFSSNRMISDACVFNLLQIGELASRALSNEFKEQNAIISWKAICGMRNRIVHGYADISLHIIWNTIIDDIPILIKEIKTTLDDNK